MLSVFVMNSAVFVGVVGDEIELLDSCYSPVC